MWPSEGYRKTAACFEDCLRKCETCGVGFSNSISGQTRIYRNPLDNIPQESRAGALETLARALNELNRRQKRVKFGFSTSEDALTWTVLTYLRESAQLQKLVRHCANVADCNEPELLLWGVPQSCRGLLIRTRIEGICDRIGECWKRRSEPDVIMDFGTRGVVVVEVKYTSGNEKKAFRAEHDKYFTGTDAFAAPERVRSSRLYELVRNWRIGVDLADGRPLALLNLVVKNREPKEIESFRSGLNPCKGTFNVITWAEFLGGIQVTESMSQYLNEKFGAHRRGVI